MVVTLRLQWEELEFKASLGYAGSSVSKLSYYFVESAVLHFQLV